MAERAGWAVDGEVGKYAPGPGWLARVRPVNVAGRTYARWHVAVIDSAGVARYVTTATTIAEAACGWGLPYSP